MTLQTETQAGRAPAQKTNFTARAIGTGLAAAFLLSCSPIALHAEISNAELAAQISELKAQIRALKGGVAEAKSEARRKRATVIAAPAVVAGPPAFATLPPGATPVYATIDKKMIFGNLTITPGGFIDMYGIFRSKNLSADTNSPLAAIPTLNNNNAHVSEGRLSARNTRLALLIESPIAKNYLVSAYGEVDFRAAGITSTPGQTNNFVPRLRLAYMGLDNNDYGMHVTAGQAWSLVTANSKGITNRNEVLPPTLDNVVLPGFDYSRTPQVRLVKDFNKKLWLGISIENPQIAGLSGSSAACPAVTAAGATATTPNPVTGVVGGTCVTAAAGSTDFGGGGLNVPVSLNKYPNIIGKAAYEARIADRDVHVEALGIFKNGTTYTRSF